MSAQCDELHMSKIFDRTHLTDDGAVALGEKFPDLPELFHLDLQGNSIGDRGAESLAAGMLHLPKLSWINLSGNLIGARGAEALARSIRHATALTGLDVSFNEIGEGQTTASERKRLIATGQGARALAAAIAALEVSRGSIIQDIYGIDEDILAHARDQAASDSSAGSSAEPVSAPSQPTHTEKREKFDPAGKLTELLHRECAHLLALAGADRFLTGALRVLGVEDLAALRVLDDSDLAEGLKEAGVPMAPRKQLRRCFQDVAGRADLTEL